MPVYSFDTHLFKAEIPTQVAEGGVPDNEIATRRSFDVSVKFRCQRYSPYDRRDRTMSFSSPASEHFYYNAFADHIDELFSIAGMDPKSQSVSSFGLLPEGWDRELPDVYGFGQRLVEDGAFAGTEFSFRAPGVERSLRLSMPGDHNVENALCAAAVCLGLGVHIDTIAEALSLVRVNGRMENVYAGHGFRVLIDYAHNEESMESLLRLLRGFRPGRLVVVFGCGGDRSRERRTGMGHVAARMADLTVMTSDNPRTEPPEAIIDDIEQAYREAGGSPDACVRISDRREAIAWAMKNARSGELQGSFINCAVFISPWSAGIAMR